MNNFRHHLIRITLASAAFLLMAVASAMGQADMAGCKDHPLFPSRMPDYRIEACKTEDFGVVDFFSMKGPKTPVEGKSILITYSFTG
jgi:hypothetical protein